MTRDLQTLPKANLIPYEQNYSLTFLQDLASAVSTPSVKQVSTTAQVAHQSLATETHQRAFTRNTRFRILLYSNGTLSRSYVLNTSTCGRIRQAKIYMILQAWRESLTLCLDTWSRCCRTSCTIE